MTEDIRFAFRQLRKSPGFAAIAVITLGLGIGAAAAIFGLIQGALLSPPPYADPDRLLLISPIRIDRPPSNRRATGGPGAARPSMGGMVVTPGYFSVLGLRPMLGRAFVDSELGRPRVPPSAIILGYDLWQRKFNGVPASIGRTIRRSRTPAPLPVVGVMPPGIRFLPDPGGASEPNYDVNAFVD